MLRLGYTPFIPCRIPIASQVYNMGMNSNPRIGRHNNYYIKIYNSYYYY